jgi:hypothetical protein
MNLAKHVKDLYKENNKLLKKEIKVDYRIWNDLLCTWIGRTNVVKMAILPKANYMFNEIPIKIPMAFITDIEILTLNFIWKQKRTQRAKAILRKTRNAGGITILNFKHTTEP